MEVRLDDLALVKQLRHWLGEMMKDIWYDAKAVFFCFANFNHDYCEHHL